MLTSRLLFPIRKLLVKGTAKDASDRALVQHKGCFKVASVDLSPKMLKAEQEPRNGFDAFHFVNKQGDLGSGLATIATSNGKTALQSAARNGHLEVFRSLLVADPGIATQTDKTGQATLSMAVKEQHIEIMDRAGFKPSLA
ncbi:ankyrin repeat-containing protein At5g02620-like isoform X2 [Mangifera indica]|uniref:ankyrin repeat-containing protein At5g02620-like isoform X2 n=1 Tax=Mangifera indica TaxID=29780 RepID=UPI001CFAE4FC|nr:ankyrin repeat-containing protein At5g02620-like isoform X2 [Mangifera indica]